MNLIKTMIAAAGVAMIGGAASAATYTPDSLIGTAKQCNDLNVCDFNDSSTDTEVEYLAGLLGVSVESLAVDKKFEEETLAFSQDMDGNWFVDVDPDQPGYFVLKFGTGNLDTPTHFFFKNLHELTKLVWTSEQVAPLMDNCSLSEPGEVLGEGDCRLSHVTTVIPLPAAGWLLIGGLGGLAAMRRRKS